MSKRSRQYLSPYRNSASILIICVWMLVFFSVMALGLYNIISSRVAFVMRIESDIIGQRLARSCVVYAKSERKKDLLKYDTLSKFKKKAEMELGRGKFIYTITDEESKININTAPFEVVAGLPGLDTKLAQAINASRLRPFKAKEEVLLVEGVDKDNYKEFKDFITVYGDGKVNINTAPPEVLKALGFDDSLIETIKEFRAGEDKIEATADDGAFTDTATILDTMRSLVGFSGSAEAKIVQVLSRNLITTASNNLCLQIETEVLGRPGSKYAVLIDIAKEKIKEWREY